MAGKAGDVKGTAISTGVGAVSGFAITKLAQQVPTLAQHWWAPGALLAVAGHFVKKKSPAAGAGLAGAAGAYLAMGYSLRPAAAPVANAKGFDQWRPDAGALVNSAYGMLGGGGGDAGAWNVAASTSDVNRTSSFNDAQGVYGGDHYSIGDAMGLQSG